MSLDELEEKLSDKRVKFVTKGGVWVFQIIRQLFVALLCRTRWPQSWQRVIRHAIWLCQLKRQQVPGATAFLLWYSFGICTVLPLSGVLHSLFKPCSNSTEIWIICWNCRGKHATRHCRYCNSPLCSWLLLRCHAFIFLALHYIRTTSLVHKSQLFTQNHTEVGLGPSNSPAQNTEQLSCLPTSRQATTATQLWRQPNQGRWRQIRSH